MSEQGLWAAVIHQAMSDALATPDKHAKHTSNIAATYQEARAARDWFINGGKDFIRARCNAEMDPAFVRDGAIRQMRQKGVI